MVEFRKTDKFCEYQNMHFADITDIYYNNLFVGWKFYDKWRRAGQIWYVLACDVDFIPECEKKFGYGWMLEDNGFAIYPEDGSLTIEQIEQELIPQACVFILNHAIEFLDAAIKIKNDELTKANSDFINAYAEHESGTPYTHCDQVMTKCEDIQKELDDLHQQRERVVESLFSPQQ